MVGIVLDGRESGFGAQVLAEDVAQFLARDGEPTHRFRLVPTPVQTPRLVHSLHSSRKPAATLEAGFSVPEALQTSRLEPHDFDTAAAALAEQLAQHVAQKRLTSLHAIGLDLPATVCQLVQRRTGTPWFVTPRAADLRRDDPRFHSRARAALRAARHVLLFDTETVHDLEGRLGLAAGEVKVQVLSRGADLDRFQPAPRRERAQRVRTLGASADLRARLEGIDWTHSFVVLTAAPALDRHGFQQFLFALPELLRQQLRLVVIVVGDDGDPLTDGLRAALAAGRPELLHGVVTSSELCQPLVDHLERLAQEGRTNAWWEAAARLEPERRVRFVGWVPRPQFATLLGLADVFVLPAVASRPPSQMFYEALACGVLPVGTESSGIGEIARRIAAELSPEIAALCALRCDAQPVHEIELKLGRLARLQADLAPALRALAERAYAGDRVGGELRRIYTEAAPTVAARA
jgi:glycosyltransferase involved in cell wall biosynthesis